MHFTSFQDLKYYEYFNSSQPQATQDTTIH